MAQTKIWRWSLVTRLWVLVGDFLNHFNVDKCLFFVFFYYYSSGQNLQTSTNLRQYKNRSALPKPSGCPPMRTILHSSPEELVKRRSAGNLRIQIKQQLFNLATIFKCSKPAKKRTRWTFSTICVGQSKRANVFEVVDCVHVSTGAS